MCSVIYKEEVSPTMKQLDIIGGSINRAAGDMTLPEIQSVSWCPGFNFGLFGVGHTKMCRIVEAVHVKSFHICAICASPSHGALNCPFIRSCARLTKFEEKAFKWTLAEKGLPRDNPKPKPHPNKRPNEQKPILVKPGDGKKGKK